MSINCRNWDSYIPEKLTDSATGQCIGILQPRITLDILCASRGITSHSIPEVDERDQPVQTDLPELAKFFPE